MPITRLTDGSYWAGLWQNAPSTLGNCRKAVVKDALVAHEVHACPGIHSVFPSPPKSELMDAKDAQLCSRVSSVPSRSHIYPLWPLWDSEWLIRQKKMQLLFSHKTRSDVFMPLKRPPQGAEEHKLPTSETEDMGSTNMRSP